MTEKQNFILEWAVNKYGAANQLDMTTEEAAELIQSINKLKRAGLSGHSIPKPNKDMSLEAIKAYNDICSEVADLKIMIAQLELILCKDRIKISVDRKIERLERRIFLK